LAAASLNNGATKPKAEPHAPRLGCEKRLENLFKIVCIDPIRYPSTVTTA
jgi:hypothetical protein